MSDDWVDPTNFAILQEELEAEEEYSKKLVINFLHANKTCISLFNKLIQCKAKIIQLESNGECDWKQCIHEARSELLDDGTISEKQFVDLVHGFEYYLEYQGSGPL